MARELKGSHKVGAAKIAISAKIFNFLSSRPGRATKHDNRSENATKAPQLSVYSSLELTQPIALTMSNKTNSLALAPATTSNRDLFLGSDEISRADAKPLRV